MPTELTAGLVVEVQSLQSQQGKNLNCRRCVIIWHIESESRWVVQTEGDSERGSDARTTLKATNLNILSRLLLPTGNHRGMVTRAGDPTAAVKLCEQRPTCREADFEPCDTEFGGVAIKCENLRQ